MCICHNLHLKIFFYCCRLFLFYCRRLFLFLLKKKDWNFNNILFEMISSVVCIINNMEQRIFIYYLHLCLSKKKLNNSNKIKGTIYKLTLKVFIRVLFLKIKNPLFRWSNEKFHFLLILRKRSKLNDFWLRVFSSRSKKFRWTTWNQQCRTCTC